MRILCELFGKSRQAWYEAKKRKDETGMEDFIIVEEIKRIRKEQPRIGVEKLQVLLQDFLSKHTIKMGRDKLYELVRRANLSTKVKRRRASTTNSRHHFYIHPNLIKGKTILKSNQTWVSDLTYIYVGQGFAYLSLITDAYSKKIVGYALDDTLQTRGCLKALKMALDTLPAGVQNLIHHSDRGVQYCSNEYISLLKENHILISMAALGDPYENALAERMNKTLKEDFEIGNGFMNFEAAQRAIASAINIYNAKRPHRSLDFLTPQQAHGLEGELRKRWKRRKQTCKVEKG